MNNFNTIADNIANDVKNKTNNKSMKVKTLLGLFNYDKRTEEITTTITELLAEREIIINPSIMKIGDIWQLDWNARVYLSSKTDFEISSTQTEAKIPQVNHDDWFDTIKNKTYRNEKEVETKFILPLLSKLGYNEDDRYDGMTCEAQHGSKPSVLELDFALFNKNSNIHDQVLLIVEGKREEKLYKDKEIKEAQMQTKSYGYWLGCRYGLLTNSRTIQVLDLISPVPHIKILFSCQKEELKDRFNELYKLISKESLTKFYENKMKD